MPRFEAADGVNRMSSATATSRRVGGAATGASDTGLPSIWMNSVGCAKLVPADSTIDAISTRYTGQPFPMRSGTVFVIEAARAATMTLPFSD